MQSAVGSAGSAGRPGKGSERGLGGRLEAAGAARRGMCPQASSHSLSSSTQGVRAAPKRTGNNSRKCAESSTRQKKMGAAHLSFFSFFFLPPASAAGSPSPAASPSVEITSCARGRDEETAGVGKQWARRGGHASRAQGGSVVRQPRALFSQLQCSAPGKAQQSAAAPAPHPPTFMTSRFLRGATPSS